MIATFSLVRWDLVMKKYILIAICFFLLITAGCDSNKNVNLENNIDSKNEYSINKDNAKEEIYGLND